MLSGLAHGRDGAVRAGMGAEHHLPLILGRKAAADARPAVGARPPHDVIGRKLQRRGGSNGAASGAVRKGEGEWSAEPTRLWA